jgi:Ca2+-binding EF-hand superfamily protein
LFETTDEDSPIVLIDFGLSKFCTYGSAFFKKAGSSYYAAPEIFGTHGYSKSCDLWSLGVVMFVMLFAFPPFHGKRASSESGDDDDEDERGVPPSDSKVLAQVVRGFDATVRPGFGAFFPASLPVSAAARDLIAKLLTNATRRLTIEEALVHPWLHGSAAKSAQALSPLVIAGMKSFDSSCRFQKAVLSLMQSSLSLDDVETLKTAFHKLDADQDGCITITELQAALVASDTQRTIASSSTATNDESKAFSGCPALRFPATQLARIMKNLDVNCDGSISYDELLLSFVHRKVTAKQERLVALFQQLDTDKNGRLSLVEFKACVSSALLNDGDGKKDKEDDDETLDKKSSSSNNSSSSSSSKRLLSAVSAESIYKDAATADGGIDFATSMHLMYNVGMATTLKPTTMPTRPLAECPAATASSSSSSSESKQPPQDVQMRSRAAKGSSSNVKKRKAPSPSVDKTQEQQPRRSSRLRRRAV